MSTDTPRPERVTLGDEERELLFTAVEREDYYADRVELAVQRIIAAREKALREEIAKELDAWVSVEKALSTDPTLTDDEHRMADGAEVAYEHAARIARGETQ